MSIEVYNKRYKEKGCRPVEIMAAVSKDGDVIKVKIENIVRGPRGGIYMKQSLHFSSKYSPPLKDVEEMLEAVLTGIRQQLKQEVYS